jgi:hypothetical protein
MFAGPSRILPILVSMRVNFPAVKAITAKAIL